ncbi:MAG TPA: hypothetical protein VJS67_10805 [Pseudonocardiaceae bacterium]|nr:hypothetical protein [Pseudonocardiaceae bacterium]
MPSPRLRLLSALGVRAVPDIGGTPVCLDGEEVLLLLAPVLSVNQEMVVRLGAVTGVNTPA